MKISADVSNSKSALGTALDRHLPIQGLIVHKHTEIRIRNPENPEGRFFGKNYQEHTNIRFFDTDVATIGKTSENEGALGIYGIDDGLSGVLPEFHGEMQEIYAEIPSFQRFVQKGFQKDLLDLIEWSDRVIYSALMSMPLDEAIEEPDPIMLRPTRWSPSSLPENERALNGKGLFSRIHGLE